jgi:hypothetical protein
LLLPCFLLDAQALLLLLELLLLHLLVLQNLLPGLAPLLLLLLLLRRPAWRQAAGSVQLLAAPFKRCHHTLHHLAEEQVGDVAVQHGLEGKVYTEGEPGGVGQGAWV